MEHIFTFSINLDDNRIQEQVYDAAMNQIVSDLNKDFRAQLFNNLSRNGVQPWVEEQFRQFLNENKDGITDKAAGILAEKLSRSKSVREIAGEVAQEAAKE